jgi:hypothetical protein
MMVLMLSAGSIYAIAKWQNVKQKSELELKNEKMTADHRSKLHAQSKQPTPPDLVIVKDDLPQLKCRYELAALGLCP